MADGVHEHSLRDSGGGSRVVPRRKQLAARQAARRGDAEQPRRCAGCRAGAHRRGEDSPLTRLTDLLGGEVCVVFRGSEFYFNRRNPTDPISEQSLAPHKN
jgi:hypothetical protein